VPCISVGLSELAGVRGPPPPPLHILTGANSVRTCKHRTHPQELTNNHEHTCWTDTDECEPSIAANASVMSHVRTSPLPPFPTRRATYVYTHAYMYKPTYVYSYMYIYMCACLCICVLTCVYIYMYQCIHVNIHIYVCVYVHT